MSQIVGIEGGWSPAIGKNFSLLEANPQSFADAIGRFREWAKEQPAEPLTLTTGVHTLTAEQCERLLLRNKKNRHYHFLTVQGYAIQLANSEWKMTGQPVIFADNGVLVDGQHRLMAGYLSGRGLTTFVVTGIPYQDQLFAYIDNSRPRSASDTLQTAGINGVAAKIARVVQDIAHRWDQGQLVLRGRVSVPRLTNREVLGYVQDNPELTQAAQLIEANYRYQVSRLGQRPVAIFVAWKVIEKYGEEQLDAFMAAIMEDQLPEGHPTATLRKKLENPPKSKKSGKIQPWSLNETLYFTIKAFNAFYLGQTLKTLKLELDADFPQFVEPTVLEQAAQ